MGRMTRKKAADLAESLHMDEDAVLEMQEENAARAAKANTPEPADRAPLGELEPNSAESKSQSEDTTQEFKKSTRGRKAGKKGGAKATKDLAASTTSRLENSNHQEEILPDDNDSAPSPASEQAAEDLLRDVPELDIAHMSIHDAKVKKSQSAAVKLTRSQLAKQAELEAEPKTLVDGIGQTPEEQAAMKEEQLSVNPYRSVDTTEPSQDSASLEPAQDRAMDNQTSPPPNAVPKAIANLRADTPATRSTSNKENVEPVEVSSPQPSNYDTLENAVVSTTPSTETPRQTASIPQDSIAALDELDDAVENVNRDIPEVQTSPEKAKAKRESKKAAPVVRTTKASQARISMAQNPDAGKKQSSLGKPSPTKALGRASSVRESSAARRIPSGSSSKGALSGVEGERKEAIIPHSKPRPVSLSFPTPPPPPKSTKAPTQSTFQLPGEAVAAKLKAQREARVQRAAEEEVKEAVVPHSKPRPVSMSFPTPPPPSKSTKPTTQSTFQLPGEAVAAKLKAQRDARVQRVAEEEEKRVFKARPVPTSLSKAPSVRQTTASKGRESMMTGKDLKASPTSSTATGLKRANSVATTRPAAPKARMISRDTTKPATTNGKPVASELAVKKRPSTALASMSNPRTSIFGNSVRTSTVPEHSTTDRATSNPAKATSKGKEVFNRAANAKATEVKEKAEKEAAAKKARADAAERGRQASREWAEKQKQKKSAAAKPAKEPEAIAPAQETSFAEQPIVEASAVEGATVET